MKTFPTWEYSEFTQRFHRIIPDWREEQRIVRRHLRHAQDLPTCCTICIGGHWQKCTTDWCCCPCSTEKP